MSPTSTTRHPSPLRKITLCAAALAVSLLPTACGTAYADSGHAGHGTVQVGHAAAAAPIDDQQGAAEDGADQNEQNEQPGDAGGAEAPADDGNATGEADPPQNEQNGGQNNGDNNADDNNADNNADNNNADNNAGNNAGNNNAGDDAGVAKNDPGNGRDGQEEPPPPDNGQGGNGNNGQLDVLGTDCTNSQLEPHNGFEEAPRCVDTSFGEVAAEENSPSLLITEAPQTVKAGQDFSITVSTRNLIRDRFLGAAAGGYYLESSFLNADGLQRGHFHTACRVLKSTAEAPDAAPDPEFFVATQDNGGSAAPDQVKIDVPGIDTTGTIQCSSWAGDGSHRIPMMQRANQTPAFDSVRITVE
jgi:hypothetical protein